MKEAILLGEAKIQRETIEKSMEFLIRLKNQVEIRHYRGKLKWEGNLERDSWSTDNGLQVVVSANHCRK